MPHRLSSIEAAIAAIRRGEVVVVVDAEDRENEGDFVCAADKVTPEIVNFMITHGRGQFCVPVLPEICQPWNCRSWLRKVPIQSGPLSLCRSIIARRALASLLRSVLRPWQQCSTQIASRKISFDQGIFFR